MSYETTISHFKERLNAQSSDVLFEEIIAIVDEHFDFTPTAFQNGELHNDVGQNSGSCKVFSVAQIIGLDEQQTLVSFGQYYRDDVLSNPEGEDHQNIRNFMKTGWAGIDFEQSPLQMKEH
ncbi:MAG: Type III effector HopPmaJ [uncultured Thiotrichaceae bacterium]|uniref:Type III effector HopPmaJ n=1 Tax=uncultured Thiotrichaceae bacterium TaxID=298394 RepID=A0A6S6THY4_9GAMM|nr:MAG: Type III effector HopPmaJ [uncultured Thiotrichaceae bacterium]